MGRHSCGVIALPAAVQPRAGWGRRPLAAQVPPRVRSRRRRRLGRGPRASAGGRDPGRDGSAGRSEVRAPNSPPVPSGPPAPSQAARRAREGTALLCGAGPPEPGRPAATLAVTPSPGGREETARPCAVRLARPRPPSNSPPRAGPLGPPPAPPSPGRRLFLTSARWSRRLRAVKARPLAALPPAEWTRPGALPSGPFQLGPSPRPECSSAASGCHGFGGLKPIAGFLWSWFVVP